jgi:predicted transcriptional regulator
MDGALATAIGVAQAPVVTVELPKKVEDDLRVLAQRQGRSIDVLLEEAIEQYLEAAAITDTTPDEIAATQEALLGELPAMEEWETEDT